MRPMGLAFRKQIYAHAFRQFAILPHIGCSPAVGVVVSYHVGCLIAHTQRLLLGNLIVESRVQENVSTIGIRGSAAVEFPVAGSMELGFGMGGGVRAIQSHSHFAEDIESACTIVQLHIIKSMRRITALHIFRIKASAQALSALANGTQTDYGIGLGTILRSGNGNDFCLQNILGAQSLEFVQIHQFPAVEINLGRSTTDDFPTACFARNERQLADHIFCRAQFAQDGTGYKGRKGTVLIHHIGAGTLDGYRLQLLGVGMQTDVHGRLAGQGLRLIAHKRNLQHHILIGIRKHEASILRRYATCHISLADGGNQHHVGERQRLLVLIHHPALDLFHPGCLARVLNGEIGVVLYEGERFPLQHHLQGFLLSLSLDIGSNAILVGSLIGKEDILLARLFNLLQHGSKRFVMHLKGHTSALSK